MRFDMKLGIVVLALLAVAACSSTMQKGPEGVEDSALGLSKTSVFDTPDPIVPVAAGGDPGDNELLGAYFSESPPMIPHRIDDHLPILIGDNLCLGCHDLPEQIGKPLEPGDPTPAPASHYTDLRRSPGEVGGKLIGARFVCVQCHVPQADAAPLVDNTYRQ